MTAKFRIKKNIITKQYHWNLSDDNGEKIAHHEMYQSKQACKKGIANVIDAAARAIILDESDDIGTDPEVPILLD